MNGDGEIFDRVFENVGGQVIRDDNEIEVLENNSNMAIGGMGDISTLKAHTSYPIPTSNTIITYAVLNSYNSVKSKYEINFKEFCLGCAAGEVSNDYFDGAARQANVIAIKTFVWHYYILPHDQDAGYNLNSTQINYNFQYLERTNINNISKDVLAVNNIWMESASGKIFVAYFKKGARNGDGKNGGELKQEGSYYLATQGYTRLGILHYYYDNSSASQAEPVQFFYTSGGSCYK